MLTELDGSDWRSYTPAEKLYLVRGFLLGSPAVTTLLLHYETEIDADLLSALSFYPTKDEDIVKEIDTFYARQHMMNIPIWQAIYIRNAWKADSVPRQNSTFKR